MRKATGIAVRQQTEHCRTCHTQEQDDGNDLDQCKPELKLTIIFHAEQISNGQQQGDSKRELPDGDIGEPGMKNGSRRIGFQWDHQHPEPPVEPADGKSGPASQRFIGVGWERAWIGWGDGHLC